MNQTINKTNSRFRQVAQYARSLWERREFAWYLATGNLKARNASTALGLVWWVVNPLLLGLVYFLIFGVLFETGRNIGYLLSGIFVFHFTSQATTGGANSIIQNSKLLANLKFPRLILPIANLLEASFGFLASILVLYAIAIPAGDVAINSNIFLLLLILPIHFIFNLGLSAITARLAVPFRDINNILPYANRLWLYLSPIIWPITLMEQMSEQLQTLVRLNPLFSIITVYRAALLGTELPAGALLNSAIAAVAVGLIGTLAFVRYESHIVRHL